MSKQKLVAVIVDDEAPLRAVTRAYAERAFPQYELEVHEGKNGVELEVLVEQHKPGVVISDNNMTGGDGIDAVRRMRAKGYAEPVVIFTGDYSQAQQRAAGIPNLTLLNKPCSLLDFQQAVLDTWPQYFQ